MPYLQLDVNGRHATADKQQLAARMAETYATMMAVDVRRISIVVRECGDGAVWRLVDGEPVPVSVLMCDIRSGRPPDLRLALAKRLIVDCVEMLGLREDRLNVEFTQHSGDEMYHDPGRLQPGLVPGRKLRQLRRDRFPARRSRRGSCDTTSR